MKSVCGRDYRLNMAKYEEKEYTKGEKGRTLSLEFGGIGRLLSV